MVKSPDCKVCGKKGQGQYRCPVDHINYVACFKQHKQSCASQESYAPVAVPVSLPLAEQFGAKEEEAELRPRKRLRDLQWPQEPDESLWSDPLSKHDVKPLRHIEYEAVATDGRIRELMTADMQDTLKRLSKLPPRTREQTIRTLLGVPADPLDTTYRPAMQQQQRDHQDKHFYQRKSPRFHVTDKERGKLLHFFKATTQTIDQVRSKKGD